MTLRVTYPPKSYHPPTEAPCLCISAEGTARWGTQSQALSAKEALQSSCYCGSGILWPLPHSPEQACAALNTGRTLHSLPGEILLPATLTPVPRSVLLMLQVFASS